MAAKAGCGTGDRRRRMDSIAVIVIGIAIYLYTAFWGFALIARNACADRPPESRVKGLHRFVRNPMYIGVALVIGGQAWLFHSLRIAIYMVCMLLLPTCSCSSMKSQTLRKQLGRSTSVIAKQYALDTKEISPPLAITDLCSEAST